MITNEQKDSLLHEYYDRGVLKKEIRSYEVSLWTLQDDFITVLKWSDVEQRGRIENGKMTLNIDGTQKLTFSIPMYYRLRGELIENPSWFNSQGQLLKGLRKIKVIFNKGEYPIKEASSHVFEFVIMNVEEGHDKDILTCEVEADGLAFQELGKIGYKLNLSQDNFELDYKEWDEKGYWINRKGDEVYTQPIQNINYWCEECCELEKFDSTNYTSRVWYYDVQMNWKSFEGITERASDKVYEESYTTSWSDETLVPSKVENAREKARAVEAEHSNLYNITQDIAEKFGIFCRYEYLYDENYHIIGKKIVFYNNFMNDDPSKMLSLQYPYSASKVTRKMESEEVTTKLFVLDTDDSSIAGGYCSIMDAPPNFSHEDYILNFDYMLACGGINQEQYDAIATYNAEMRAANETITELQQQLSSYQLQLPELQAKKQVLEKSADLAEEEARQKSELRNTLDAKDGEKDGYIQLTASNPDYILVSGDKKNYINLKNSNKGVVDSSIEIYTSCHTSSNGKVLARQITDFKVEYDNETNNVIGITINNPDDLKKVSSIDWDYIFNTYYKPENYDGNVDLRYRPIVPAQKFIDAGYTDFEGTYGTLYSASFTETASDGKTYDIVYTPVMSDGTILSQEDVDTYFDGIITNDKSTAQWKSADAGSDGKKLILKIAEKTNDHQDTWAENLHELQAEWDIIRADNNWFRYQSNPGGIEFEPVDYSHLTYCTEEQFNAKVTLAETRYVYLIYKYDPCLYYDNIVKIWNDKFAKDTVGKQEAAAEITRIEAEIETIQAAINSAIADKEKKIKAFERMMGPALREGYWQPEDYNDYGEHHIVTSDITEKDITEDSGKGAIIAWDSKLFDEEQTLYYEIGVGQNIEYYPCIDLNAVFTSGIPNDLSDYSIVWKATNLQDYSYDFDSIKDLGVMAVDSQALVRFIKYNNTIKPVLVLVGAKTYSPEQLLRMMSQDGAARLEKYIVSVDQNGAITVSHTNDTSIGANWLCFTSYTSKPENWPADLWSLYTQVTDKEDVPLVYPRVKFSSLLLKTDSTNFSLKYNGTKLEVGDYYIRTRNTKRTSNNQYYPEYYATVKPELIVKYGIDNQLTIDYVLSNANTSIYLDALQVSKENAYPKASYTVSTNVLDVDLTKKLYTARAQIVMVNDVQLKLHDAFGYISQVELDLDHYENDAIEVKNYKTKFEDLFSTIVAQTEGMKQISSSISAAISGEIPLAETALTQTLTENEIFNEYLDQHFLTSEIVQENLAQMFEEAGTILGNANKALKQNYVLSVNNAGILGKFAEQVANELSVQVTRSMDKPDTYKIGDIWIQIDEEGNEIARYIAMSSSDSATTDRTGTGGFTRTYDGTLASITGAALNINADDGIIDINAGNTINIAANENVNIVGNKEVNIGGTIINIGSIGNDTNYGGINLIATAYNTNNFEGVMQNRVLIHPDQILMAGSTVTILTGSAASTQENPVTNAVELSGEGIWIGSSKSITLFSADNSSSTANVEINPSHILFGMNNLSNGNSTAVELTESQIIFGAGNGLAAIEANGITKTGTTAGVQITKDKIGLAVGTNVDDNGNGLSVFLMDASGLIIGTRGNDKTPEANNTYVKISGNGIEVGSGGSLDINTTNFLIDSNASITANSNETMFRLGTSGAPALEYKNNTLSVTGTITANALYIYDSTAPAGEQYPSATDWINAKVTPEAIWLGVVKHTTGDPNATIGSSTSLELTDTKVEIKSTGNFIVDAANVKIKTNAGNGESIFKLTDGASNNPINYFNIGKNSSGNLFAQLGGWIITENRLHSGTGSNYVGLDSGSHDMLAMWAGKEDPDDTFTGSTVTISGTTYETISTRGAPFRVTRNGRVYMDKLMLWDSTNHIYKEVDFSDFNQAVALSLSCSGTTISAQANFWGKFNTSASKNATASIGAVSTSGASVAWGVGTTNITVQTEVGNLLFENITVNATAIAENAHNNVVSKINSFHIYTSGDSTFNTISSTQGYADFSITPSSHTIGVILTDGWDNSNLIKAEACASVDGTPVTYDSELTWTVTADGSLSENTVTAQAKVNGTVVDTQSVDVSEVYNAGWNDCRQAMLNSAYTSNYYTGPQQVYDQTLDTWYANPHGTTITRYLVPNAK